MPMVEKVTHQHTHIDLSQCLLVPPTAGDDPAWSAFSPFPGPAWGRSSNSHSVPHASADGPSRILCGFTDNVWADLTTLMCFRRAGDPQLFTLSAWVAICRRGLRLQSPVTSAIRPGCTLREARYDEVGGRLLYETTGAWAEWARCMVKCMVNLHKGLGFDARVSSSRTIQRADNSAFYNSGHPLTAPSSECIGISELDRASPTGSEQHSLGPSIGTIDGSVSKKASPPGADQHSFQNAMGAAEGSVHKTAALAGLDQPSLEAASDTTGAKRTNYPLSMKSWKGM